MFIKNGDNIDRIKNFIYNVIITSLFWLVFTCIIFFVEVMRFLIKDHANILAKYDFQERHPILCVLNQISIFLIIISCVLLWILRFQITKNKNKDIPIDQVN